MERTSSSFNMEEGSEFTFKQNLIRTSSNNDQPTLSEAVEPHQSTAVDASRFRLTSLQPFVRNSKGYRPIVFNPRTPASHNIAQTVS